MTQRTPLERATSQRPERRLSGRRMLLLGTMALSLMACDLFGSANNVPTPAPIVFNTPTSTDTGPTVTPIPFQTVVPTASTTETPPDSTPGSTETPYGTPTVTSTESPGPTETPSYAPTDTPAATTAPTYPPAATPTIEQSTGRQEVEAAGTYTYTNYYDTNSQQWYLRAGETVVASCVLFVQNPNDAGDINAWYRLAGLNGYNGETIYAAADTFMDPSTQQASAGNYDHSLAVCPDSPLPPQHPNN